MPRPKNPLLDPEMIVDAAMELVATPKGLTMPGLADKLGVSVSSIYHHVHSRAVLVERMRGRLVGRQRYDVDWDGPWRTVLTDWARAYRDAFAPYPQLVTLLTSQTVTAPEVLDVYELVATVIVRAGFPRDDVLSIITMFDTFALGSALDRAAPERVWATDDPGRVHLAAAVTAAPTGPPRADAAFEYGLRGLVNSLAVTLESSITTR